MAFAILRDTLSEQKRAKVLSLINGITCIVPVLAPVIGHLIMLKFPWQSLFYMMAGMGMVVCLLSALVLKETHPGTRQNTSTDNRNTHEPLLQRFFLSRLAITTLSVTVILTFVNVSPVLLMEELGLDRGQYSSVMASTALVSMLVAFSTPFALSLFRQRTLMLTAQVMFAIAAVVLSVASSVTVSLIGFACICAGFSLGFGVTMSQALAPFAPAREWQARYWGYRRCAALRCGFGLRRYSELTR